jgi:hypothetical protein
MPNPQGRTGKAGNSTDYKPINIRTPNPGMLKAGKGNLSHGDVFSGKVPGRSKGKFTNKAKGTKGY